VTQIILYPWRAFVYYPDLCFFIAACYCILGWRKKRMVSLTPAAAWVGYGIWENRMQAWSETVVAPIRIDLLAIAPILMAVSVIALVFIFDENLKGLTWKKKRVL